MKRLLSTDHFCVDGTLIEASASMKRIKPKAPSGGDEPPPSGDGRNAEVDFKGQKRSNETHQRTTDPEARLYRQGSGMEARLFFMGHGMRKTRLPTRDKVGWAFAAAAYSLVRLPKPLDGWRRQARVRPRQALQGQMADRGDGRLGQ